MDLRKILRQYFADAIDYEIQPLGAGLIHKTFGVGVDGNARFVLQQINTEVFQMPDAIAHNVNQLLTHAHQHRQDPCFPAPISTLTSHAFARGEQGEYFRLTPFIPNSHAITTCNSSDEAYEAAHQFGRFSASYASLDCNSLKETIPGFHDLQYRWQQFNEALISGVNNRITASKKLIQQMVQEEILLKRYLHIIQSAGFKKRVTHHDTKISNVLFNASVKGVCVIDMDTTMSGYFISDLGDMFRTYLSPGNEEETDLEQVGVRKEYLEAILQGYNEKMSDQLTDQEKEALYYAGEFMMWMQALRFMTDYLMGDIYYGITYEANNLNRAINQMHLLNQYRKQL